jgi:hypothetical protein
MKNYLERARKLLEESMKGENPFDKYKIIKPVQTFYSFVNAKPENYSFQGIDKESILSISKSLEAFDIEYLSFDSLTNPESIWSSNFKSKCEEFLPSYSGVKFEYCILKLLLECELDKISNYDNKISNDDLNDREIKNLDILLDRKIQLLKKFSDKLKLLLY